MRVRKMKKKIKTNSIALAAAAAMIFNLFVPFAFAEGDKAYIYLSSAADLVELANNCMIDSYSTGRTVVMKQDIDLSGTEFNSIGYFNGTFDGAGYTISGLTLEVSDPERGFIGIIGKDGKVKNLNIKADIKEHTEKKNDKKLKIIDSIAEEVAPAAERLVDSPSGIYTIGGICGINKGLISGCTFTGTVKADRNIGGICGINENTGRIEASANKGAITGNENTGGVCGKNSGVLKWCTNEGKINSEPNETAKNTGGIAGTSDGAILQSKNNGVIGYPNTGTNTGGIVGSQSGFVSECENKAQIYGKKETGGICGRFEPYINIDFKQDELGKKLDEQKAQLKSDLNSIHSDIKNDAQKVRDNYNALRNGLFPELRNGAGLLDLLGGGSSVGGSLQTIADSLAALNNALGGQVESVDLSGGMDSLKNLVDSTDSTVARLADNMDTISSSLESSNTEIDALVQELSKAVADGNTDRSDLTDTITKKIKELDTSLNMDLGGVDVGGIDISGIDLSETDYQLSRAIEEISELLGDDIADLFDPLLKISDAIKDVIKKLNDRHQAIEDAKKKLEELLEQLKQNVPTLPPKGTPKPTNQPSETTLPLVTEQPKKKSLKDLVSKLETTAYAEDGEDKNDKTTLQRLADMDIHDMDIPVTRKIAGEEFDSALIKYCINSGPVNGVSDAGGIAGAVGFEIAINDNVNKNGRISLNPSTAIKAVIGTCINEGTITAKNTTAGGITGFSDLGSVKESLNTGDITVTEGSYAGGITGYHLNNITRCISTGDLSATSDIGGIVGKGTNIEGSYALARTTSEGERCGAIAGSSSGTIKYNYFLKEKLGGINGVDYKEKAQGVSKEVLAQNGTISNELKGFSKDHYAASEGDLYMPQLKAFTENTAESLGNALKAKSADAAQFKFKATFILNGKEIKTVKLNYGDTIPENEIPVLDKRKGQYGVWDKDTKQEIVRNTVFTAVYSQSTSALSYGGEPPVLLTEGNFSPSAVLEVKELNAKSIVNDKVYEPKCGYQIKITEGEKEYSDTITVRVRDNNGKNTKIGIIENGAVVVTDAERDGSYIKFEMTKPGEFIVLRQKNSVIALCMMIAGGLILILLLLTLIKKRKKRKQLIQTAEANAQLEEGSKTPLIEGE